MVAEVNYKAPEVAKILRVSVFRVHELTRLDILPHFRMGRQIRYPQSKIQAFIDAGGRQLPGGWRRKA